jgi:NO-binding membrane sensor protein with MHYT domain
MTATELKVQILYSPQLHLLAVDMAVATPAPTMRRGLPAEAVALVAVAVADQIRGMHLAALE